MKRSFLFLQGPCSPFFSRLASALMRAGHTAHQVVFCTGDLAYCDQRIAIPFRDKPDALLAFLRDCYHYHGVTDQIVFGDCRPMHRDAILAARANGIRNHVFEEGYFRPWWITLEREGVNHYSLISRDPVLFFEAARHSTVADKASSFSTSFLTRALHDVVYHLTGSLNPLLFPHYRTHALVTAPREYAGYARSFIRRRWIRRRELSRCHDLLHAGLRYYLLPLQLDGDSQIRDHSRFSNMAEVCDEVLASFNAHAPGDTSLIIKNHPLDPGLNAIGAKVKALARHYGLEDRVHFFEEAELDSLVRGALGVVTVNSTVGMVSLSHARPTLALADAIYHLPGLTSAQRLDDFWRDPARPDMTLFAGFRQVLMETSQINGGFYSSSGISLAVSGSLPLLTGERVTSGGHAWTCRAF
jgi:capsular polysaccharide export protein